MNAHARRRADSPAIMAPGREPLTYGRLHTHIEETIGALNAFGLGRRDRVAIVLPPGPGLAAAFLTVAAGATCVPLNPAYTESEFDFYLSNVGARALIVQKGQESPAIRSAHKLGIQLIQLSPRLDSQAGTFTLEACERVRPVQGGVSQHEDIALLLFTSGTTSQPKVVPLTHMNICTSATNIAATLGLSERDRCMNLMPLFHIHGLIGSLLSSVAAGASFLSVPYYEVPGFAQWTAEFSPTWYTTVPTVHQEIVRHIQAQHPEHCRSLRFVRSSSAPMSAKLRDELEALLRVPVIEAYGMTEAAHQISSNPLPPGQRKAGSVGLATGPEAAIMDGAGRLLEPNRTGEIVIRGASVFAGYENNPTANSSAFQHGWFRTGDQGFVDEDGYLFITGRLKEMINRGGEKISPREVDDVLMGHPDIREAVTFRVPHDTLGEDVAAAVVLRERASATRREIREFASRRLAAFKVPRRVVIVEEIPKGASGKPQRFKLAEALGLNRLRDGREVVAPERTVEYQLIEIWEQLLGVKPIGVEDDFFELGGHSLLAVQLMNEIERVFGRRLPITALLADATVEGLANLLLDHPVADGRLLVKIQDGASKPPFFFLHGDHVGGGFYSLKLARGLGEERPFYVFVPHGMDGRPLPSVEAMAACYVEMMRSAQPHGPYLLGGFCNGGVIAFEMARQLQQQGQKVDALILIAASAWNSPCRWLYRLVNRVGGIIRLSPEERVNQFRRIRDRLMGLSWVFDYYVTRLKTLAGLARRAPGTFALKTLKRGWWALAGMVQRDPRRERPADVSAGPQHPEHRPLWAKYKQILSNYVPGEYHGDVTLFWPYGNPVKLHDDPTMGWDDVADRVTVRVIPGGHIGSITTHINFLVDQLQEHLRQADVPDRDA